MSKLLCVIICCNVFHFMDSINAMRPRSGSIEITPKVQKIIYSTVDISEKVFKEPCHVNFESQELYSFVFNVGQGNFCLMRRNNKIVIVDAGKGDNLDAHITIPDVNKGYLNPFFANSMVEAVFITHPHEDHFNLFSDGMFIEGGGTHEQKISLLDMYPDSFRGTYFWLGGEQKDWQEENGPKNVIRKIGEKGLKVEYMGRGHKCSIMSFLDGVRFHVLGIMPVLSETKKANKLSLKANKLSLIIQVSFNRRNILFLGDSEGEAVDRLKYRSMDIRPLSFISGHTETNDMTISIYSKIDKLQKERVSCFFENNPDFWVAADDINIDSINETYWKLCDKLAKMELCRIQSFLPGDIVYDDILAEYETLIKQIEEYNSLVEGLEYTEEELMRAETTIGRENECDDMQMQLEELEEEIEKLKKGNDIEKLTKKCMKFKGMKEELEEKKEELEESKTMLAEEEKEKKIPKLKDEIERQSEELCSFISTLREKYEKVLNGYDPFIVQTFREKYWSEGLWENWERWDDEDNPMMYLLGFVKKSALIDYINSLLKMSLFENSQLIVLPHHGTNTENSQRFLGYFSGVSGKRAFVVSSSPFGRNHLPKRSTLEMAPITPVHPEHPFSYSQDTGSKTNKSASMKITTKPIYVTGVAPGGVYCFKISERPEDKSIYMLNLYRQDPLWFNILADYEE